MNNKLFSFHGRIGRLAFALNVLAVLVLIFALGFGLLNAIHFFENSGSINTDEPLSVLSLLLLFAKALLAYFAFKLLQGLCFRRIADIRGSEEDKEKIFYKYLFLSLIPIIGQLPWLFLFFKKARSDNPQE